MPNCFPYFLSWSLLAPFFLRLVAGAYFVYFGYNGLTRGWWDRFDLFDSLTLQPPKVFATVTATSDLTLGFLLLMGFQTQIVAIALIVACFSAIVVKRKKMSFPLADVNVYVLLGVICIALFFTGAGYYAIDLPF